MLYIFLTEHIGYTTNEGSHVNSWAPGISDSYLPGSGYLSWKWAWETKVSDSFILVLKLNGLQISHIKISWGKTGPDKHLCRLGYKM